MAPINITDEFTEPMGQWTNYAAIPTSQQVALRNQRHVNIRTFSSADRATPVVMLWMDRFQMFDLDGESLGTFSSDGDAKLIVQRDEAWTNGTVKRQTDRNNWNGITVTCDTTTSNLTTTQSIILS